MINTVLGFIDYLGDVRNVVGRPSTKWRDGPFVLDVSINAASGGPTQYDLTLPAVWQDAGFANAYALSATSTNNPKALVQIESALLVFNDAQVAFEQPGVKETLAEAFYLEAKSGSTPEMLDLFGAVVEAQDVVTDSGGTTVKTILQGAAKQMQIPVRVDLDDDELILHQRVDLNLDGTLNAKLILDGFCVPSAVRVEGNTGACNVSDGGSARGQHLNRAKASMRRARSIARARYRSLVRSR